MNWKSKFFKLMDKAGGDGGSNGGGSGGGSSGAGAGAAGSQGGGDDWKAKYEATQKELADLKAKATPPDPEKDKSLKDKADLDARAREKSNDNVRMLESAISFNVNAKTFLKDNAGLLPKEAEEIFSLADKEKYDSQLEKASEIKAGLIHSFFSVQANLDLLTATQKAAVADYLKLSKTGRQEKAQSVFENIFEPTLESVRRVKKAENVARARGGFDDSDDTDSQYRQRLMDGALKHYTGVRKNA